MFNTPIKAKVKIDEVEFSIEESSTDFQPGQAVYLKRGNKRIARTIGDRKGTGKNSGKILTLGGRGGKQEYWEDSCNLEPVPHAQQQLESETLETDTETFQSSDAQKAANYQEELLRKVYFTLPDADVYVTLPEIARELSEYAGAEIRGALKKLEEQELARPALNLDGGEILWQKDVNALVQRQQQLQPQEQAQPQPQIQEQQEESLPSTTSVAELDSDSLQEQQSLESLKSLEPVKSTTTVGEHSVSDTPQFKLQETSEMEQTLNGLQQELSQLRSRVQDSLSQENVEEQKMNGMSSLISLSESTNSEQTISALKTPQESSAVLLNQEEPPEDFLSGFSGSFPAGGTFVNGKLSEAPTLVIPLLSGSGLFWLRSTKMSTKENSDSFLGTSKLETQLRELSLLAHDQIINPEYLAKGLYSLPVNWLSQLELRSAAQIFGISDLLTEAPKTGESEQLLLEESNISNQSESVQLENRPLMSVPEVNPQNLGEQEEFPLEDSFSWRGPGKYWINPQWVDLEESTQYRVKEDEEWIRFCATCMEDDLWEWQTWALGLVWTGEKLLVYRGHHRLKAAIKAKKPALAEIKLGDLAEAKFLSVGSNKFTSVTPTVADNKNAITTLLDLQKQHGDEWLLNLINSQLPSEKHYKQVSLRALESYTGIPFRTIKNIKDRLVEDPDAEDNGVDEPKSKASKVSFSPSSEEWDAIQAIVESEGFKKPVDAIRWLIQEFHDNS